MQIINKEEECLEGTFSACGHTVCYSYFFGDNPVPTDKEAKILADEAEERARAMIAEDYIQGELFCGLFYKDDDGKEGVREYRGWWSIRSGEEK